MGGDVPEYPEKKTASDYLLPATRGAVGAGVPFVGGLLGEVLGFVWTPALERRQAEWFKKLGELVNDLSDHVDDLKERLSRENVLTILVQAARIANATHEEEKRAALRAAVVNTALDVEPDEQTQLMFLSYLDRLTVAHMQMFRLFADPPKWFEDRGQPPPQFSLSSSVMQVLEAAFPGWDKHLIAQVASDIGQMGLAQPPSLGTMMTAGGAMQGRATPMGTRFLRFIEEPRPPIPRV